MSEAAIDLDQFDDLVCGEAPPPVRVLPGTYTGRFEEYVVTKLNNEKGSAKSQLRFTITDVGSVGDSPDGSFTLEAIGGEDSLLGKSVYSEPVWFTSANADYVAKSTQRQGRMLGVDYDEALKGKSPKGIKAAYDELLGDEFPIKVRWDVQEMNGEVRTDDEGNPRYDIIATKG